MSTIDFYFDFASPYAYLAHHRIGDIARRHRRTVAYHPVDLKALKLAAGNTGPATVQIPAKLAFANRDFERWAARYDVPFATIKPGNARTLNTGALFALKFGAIEKYVERGFHEGWGSGGALDDPALIARVVGDAGLDGAAFSAWVETDEAQAAFRREFDAAVARGVFGVPIMTVGTELWFGNDRLFMLDEYLAHAS